MSYVYLGILSFAFGFFNDFSDLFVEHGLRWFNNASIFLGLIWAFSSAIIIYFYPLAGYNLVGLTLYYLVRGKIDHLAHQLGAAVLLSAAFISISKGNLQPSFVFVSLLLNFLFVFWLYQPCKRRIFPSAIKKMFTLRHLIPAVMVSILVRNFIPLFSTGFDVLGAAVSDRWYSGIKSGTSPLASRLGITYFKDGGT